jgi:UDP-2,4-diacetamido-2,4,6-trideoxy-beta-L-altropyranose hydrolase
MMTLLIRADGDARIGIGHMMRCLALAQAAHDQKDRVIFLGCCESEALRQRVEAAGVSFRPLNHQHPHPTDLATTLALLRELRAEGLVVDGYHFDSAYQRAIRAAGFRLLVIDDFAHSPEYHADLLLNQNIHAAQLEYTCSPDTTLLLGPRYALLRPEFLGWRGWHRSIPDTARKVLVTMGGGDSGNVTLRIILMMRQIQGIDLDVRVVVGPASSHLAEFRQAVIGEDERVRLLTNVTNMPTLMAWADVALAAGGSTCWELAFMGLPSVVTILADNQRGIAEGLDGAGIVMNAGWFSRVSDACLADSLVGLLLDPERRRQMSCAGQQLVDGGGAGRVIDALHANLTVARG